MFVWQHYTMLINTHREDNTKQIIQHKVQTRGASYQASVNIHSTNFYNESTSLQLLEYHKQIFAGDHFIRLHHVKRKHNLYKVGVFVLIYRLRLTLEP